MNNALLYLGGLVIVILAALFAVPTFIDWNGYRGIFEERAAHVLGRDVRVGGTVNVRFLPAPYVQFEKLRISDAGDTGESLFRADSFKMWLAVPPLLRGILQANEIELKRPVLRLAADASGGGNWSTLSFASGTLPFVPADVTLDQVKITDGILSLNGAQGAELARIDGIQGEMTADALDGPFKFKGRVRWEGADREVRLSTARPDPNGDIRFKTSVQVAGTRNSYVVEGKVANLKERPRVEGELTAQIAFASSSSGESDGAEGAGEASKRPPAVPVGGAGSRGDRTGFDVRGKVSADANGFRLSDLTMSLEASGPPQIVTGEASMSWLDKVKVDVALQSKWLDFDSSGGGTARPVEAARSFFETLADHLPVEAETNVAVGLDQLNLGGQSASGLRLKVVRSGGPLELKELRASLPGGARLAVDGVITVAERPGRFDGNLSLDGQSALRFLTWAFHDPTIGEGRTDSAFVLAGRFRLGGTFIEIRNARAEFADLPLSADVRLDLGERRRLTVSLDGHKIDAGLLYPGSVGPKLLAAFKANGRAEPAPAKPDAAAAPPVAARPALFDPSRSDLTLRIRAGRVVDGDRSLKNVTANLAIEGDRLSVESLRFATDDGLEVDVVGDAGKVRERPEGMARGMISATSPGAVATLFKLLDMPDAGLAESRLAELAPFRLAGTVGLGQRGSESLDVKADGLVEGGRMVSSFALDAGRGNWHGAPVDVSVKIEGPRAGRTLAALALGGTPDPSGRRDLGEAARRLSLRAAGVPAKGLQSLVSLSGEGLALDYSGRITIPADAPYTASDGSLRVAAADAQEVLSIAGLRLGPGIRGVKLTGEAGVSYDGEGLMLRPKGMDLGGSLLDGTLKVSSPGPGKPVQLAADLAVDSASIPRLLAPVLAAAAPRVEPPAETSEAPPRRQGEPEEPLATASLTSGIWPEQPFDLGMLDEVQGEIKARFRALVLDDGLTVSDAVLLAKLGPQSIEVAELDGTAIGSRLTTRLAFERQAAGVGLKGSVRIAGGETEAAPTSAEAGAASRPQSSLALEFEGRALSPTALITDLKGSGKLALGDVTISGIGGPAAVAAAAELALQGKGPAAGEPLAAAIRASLKQGQLPLAGLEIPVVIRDGTMKLDRVTIEPGADGRLTFDTSVELATMRFDSEWRIEARVRTKGDEGAPANVLLPAVPIVYAGQLKDFTSTDATIDVSALERELVVRKMERDVDQLERLRKLDQERARQEQERQKALEAERARGGATGTDPVTEPPPVPGEGASDADAVPRAEGLADGGETAAPADGEDRSGLDASRPRPAKKPRPPPASTYKRPAQSWNPFVTP